MYEEFSKTKEDIAKALADKDSLLMERQIPSLRQEHSAEFPPETKLFTFATSETNELRAMLTPRLINSTLAGLTRYLNNAYDLGPVQSRFEAMTGAAALTLADSWKFLSEEEQKNFQHSVFNQEVLISAGVRTKDYLAGRSNDFSGQCDLRGMANFMITQTWPRLQGDLRETINDSITPQLLEQVAAKLHDRLMAGQAQGFASLRAMNDLACLAETQTWPRLPEATQKELLALITPNLIKSASEAIHNDLTFGESDIDHAWHGLINTSNMVLVTSFLQERAQEAETKIAIEKSREQNKRTSEALPPVKNF